MDSREKKQTPPSSFVEATSAIFFAELSKIEMSASVLDEGEGGYLMGISPCCASNAAMQSRMRILTCPLAERPS